MARVVKCDMCGKTNPEVDVCYCMREGKNFFKWFWCFGSAVQDKLDICDKCWEALQEARGYVKPEPPRST